MADTKLSALPELAAASDDDILYIVDDPAGVPTSKKITKAALLAGVARLFTRKTADQTVNNSTVLVNDTHLLQAMGANETWVVEGVLVYTSDTNMDIKFAFTVPALATMLVEVSGPQTGTSTAGANTMANLVLTASGQEAPLGGIGGTKLFARITGTVRTGANAGNLQLQWAQLAAVVGLTTVHTDSYLTARKVA